MPNKIIESHEPMTSPLKPIVKYKAEIDDNGVEIRRVPDDTPLGPVSGSSQVQTNKIEEGSQNEISQEPKNISETPQEQKTHVPSNFANNKPSKKEKDKQKPNK